MLTTGNNIHAVATPKHWVTQTKIHIEIRTRTCQTVVYILHGTFEHALSNVVNTESIGCEQAGDRGRQLYSPQRSSRARQLDDIVVVFAYVHAAPGGLAPSRIN